MIAMFCSSSLVVLPDLCLGSMACFVFPSALSRHFGNQSSAETKPAWASYLFELKLSL